MAKQIGPIAKREAIAAIIRSCHYTEYSGDLDNRKFIHSGEYEAADRILDLDSDDHK